MTTRTIADRTLARFVQGHKAFFNGAIEKEALTLEDVRDYLIKLDRAQKPDDPERELRYLHVSFTKGNLLQANWKSTHGEDDASVLYMTDNGAAQLARAVLPARMFSGLKEVADIDAQGAKLAEMVWNKCAAANGTQDRCVRTICAKINGEVHRMIRACVSTTYGAYSNLKFVQDMLDNSREFAEMNILDWYHTDNFMRLRFEVQNPNVKDGQAQMIEAWNSETACRRVGLRAGVFFRATGTAMTHWDDRKEKAWNHSGNVDRIRRNVRSTYNEMLKVGLHVLEAYDDALTIDIDNAFDWMIAELEREIPDLAMTAAKAALATEDVTPGSKLASVVDATLIAARDAGDIHETYEIERAASRAMWRGCKAAKVDDDGKRVLTTAK